jgi:hypothetical protein
VARYLTVEEPLVSVHADNPEMADFIHDFVARLPARINEMQSCVNEKNGQELGRLARQLKIAASNNGGCGFGELSDAADKLVQSLAGTINWSSIEQTMSTVRNLSHRVKDTSG